MIPSSSIASAAQAGRAAIPAQQPAAPIVQAQPVEAPEDILQLFHAAEAAEEALAAANTSLHNAALRGDTQAVIQALADGANINHTTTADRDTALIQASRLGHADTVQALLDRDADLSIENIRGGNAITVAERYNRQSVLNTFFHHAAATGRHGVVTWLLDHDAVNIDQIDANGDTALIHAARNGRALTVQHLLQRGADDSIANNRGGTALMSAVRHHRLNVVNAFAAHAAALAEAQEAAQAHAAPAVDAPAAAAAAPAQADGAEHQIEGVPNPHAQHEAAAHENQVEGVPDRAEGAPEPESGAAP